MNVSVCVCVCVCVCACLSGQVFTDVFVYLCTSNIYHPCFTAVFVYICASIIIHPLDCLNYVRRDPSGVGEIRTTMYVKLFGGYGRAKSKR